MYAQVGFSAAGRVNALRHVSRLGSKGAPLVSRTSLYLPCRACHNRAAAGVITAELRYQGAARAQLVRDGLVASMRTIAWDVGIRRIWTQLGCERRDRGR